ncbi:MAG TPA: GtrA family protein [Polyangiaceae bacterium]|nr:GtrA family protein [Polyangiaceae bacterium]
MSEPATLPNDASTWRLLGRHQIGSIVATAIDFGTMILIVQALGGSAVWATAVGAALGGVTNFALGRTWIFLFHAGSVRGQGARYGLVSAASAGLNTLGEHLLHDRAHVEYVVARCIVAILVSVCWNFPLQRRFVFREGATP